MEPKKIKVLLMGDPSSGSPSIIDIFEIASIIHNHLSVSSPKMYLQNNEPVTLTFLCNRRGLFLPKNSYRDANIGIIIDNDLIADHWIGCVRRENNAPIIRFNSENSEDFRRLFYQTLGLRERGSNTKSANN